MKKIVLLILIINSLLGQNQNNRDMKFNKLDIDTNFDEIKNACDVGYELACSKLAAVYYKGTHTIKKDSLKYVNYLERSCELGNYRACSLLGNIYYKGYEKVKIDLEKSYTLHNKVCNDKNIDKNCFMVANAKLFGKGTKRDPFETEQIFIRLCKKEFEPACQALEQFLKIKNIKNDKDYLESKQRFEKQVQSKDYVIDPQTKLMWQDSIETNTTKRNFINAKKYCDELVLGGFENWRLPNASELYTLVDKKEKNNTKSFIKFSNNGHYMTSSFHHKISNTSDEKIRIWNIWFGNPWFRAISTQKAKSYTRCVRGSELPLDRKKYYRSFK